MFGKMNIEKIASKVKAKKARLSDFNLSSDERAEVIKLLKKKTHVDVTTKFIKESAKAYNEGRLVLDADFNDEDIKEAIRTTAEAYRFMDAYVNEDGTGNCGEDKSYFISERLRKGYVGAEITTNDGILLQTERGKPYGTAVAIPTDDENIVIGYSFIGKDEKYSIPVVGLYLAYKRAVEGRAAGKHGFESPYTAAGESFSLDSNTKQQLKHFEKRALAYFFPEIYSYSRGQKDKKVVYDNYDKIHARQIAILGKEKVEAAKPKPSKKKKTIKKSK